MKYEMNKCYIMNGVAPEYMQWKKGDKLFITRMNTYTPSLKIEYWINGVKGFRYFFNQDNIEKLELVSEEISFTMHVLKYAPQYMDDRIYRNYLSGKLNEEIDELRKILSEGLHNLDRINSKHLIEEMGDVFYFFTAICEAYNITLDEIKEGNIKKLQKRFQKGYWNQEEADLKRDHNE